MQKGRKVGTILMILGTVLLLAALSLLAYNRWDSQRAGRVSTEVLSLMDEASRELLTQKSDAGEPPADGVMETVTVDGYDYIGTLSIPRFGLTLPIMSEWSYPGLKIAPGRYYGSVWENDLVICGHNYERHFGKLKNLDAGDEMTFTDVCGRTFTYEVKEVSTFLPTDVQKVLDGGGEDWDLTLLTCTLGGRTRVVVRGERVE